MEVEKMVDKIIQLIHLITAGYITIYVILVPLFDQWQSKLDINSTGYNQLVTRSYLLHKLTLWAGGFAMISGIFFLLGEGSILDIWLILKLLLFILLFLSINMSTGKALRLRIKAYNRPWSRIDLINKSKNKMSNLKFFNIILVLLILIFSFFRSSN